jgi:hypothetical protein
VSLYEGICVRVPLSLSLSVAYEGSQADLVEDVDVGGAARARAPHLLHQHVGLLVKPRHEAFKDLAWPPAPAPRPSRSVGAERARQGVYVEWPGPVI